MLQCSNWRQKKRWCWWSKQSLWCVSRASGSCWWACIAKNWGRFLLPN